MPDFQKSSSLEKKIKYAIFRDMITVKEIARLAGVSAKTAERALSGETKDKRRDARERAERVRKIAAEHGYRPSELALSLRRGSVKTIGFLVDILTDQFLAAAAETAMDEAGKAGFRIALRIARMDKERTRDALEAFLASGMDGIITSCCPEQLPPQLVKNLLKQGYPLFTLCGQSGYGFSSASPDYSEALPQAIDSLIANGHKKITLCLFKGKEPDNAETCRIFLEHCREKGVDADVRIHHDRHQAETLADEKIPALILYGKYSMRIYLDRCRKLDFTPDVIGFYNEWTLAAAQPFNLHGIILERAEEAVRGAVRQVLAQISGGGKVRITPKAGYIPAEQFHSLNFPNLANQMLFEQQ